MYMWLVHISGRATTALPDNLIVVHKMAKYSSFTGTCICKRLIKLILSNSHTCMVTVIQLVYLHVYVNHHAVTVIILVLVSV